MSRLPVENMKRKSSSFGSRSDLEEVFPGFQARTDHVTHGSSENASNRRVGTTARISKLTAALAVKILAPLPGNGGRAYIRLEPLARAAPGLHLAAGGAASCLVSVGSTLAKSASSCFHFYTAASFYGRCCPTTRNGTASRRGRGLKSVHTFACPLGGSAWQSRKSCLKGPDGG